MNHQSIFRTPRELCNAVGNVIDRETGSKLTRRPWNFNEPDNTSWWLVPSTDWPAYKHGKYYFISDEADDILCGLYVEKGLDPQVASAYPSAKGSRYIMYADWTWFKLMEDLRNKKIENAIRKIAKDLPFNLEIRIDGGYVQDPGSFDPFAPRLKWDDYILIWDSGGEKFDLKRANNEAKLLVGIGNIEGFDGLRAELATLSENQWIWVDVLIAVRLLRADKNDRNMVDTITWGAEEIWSQFLCYFSPWVQ